MADDHVLAPLQRLMARIDAWRQQHARHVALAALPVAERERLLADCGLTLEAVRAAAERFPHATDLLPRLMTALGLDPVLVGTAEPATMRDLAHSCAGCVDWRACEHALADGSAAAEYRTFCPNAATLADLVAFYGATPARPAAVEAAV